MVDISQAWSCELRTHSLGWKPCLTPSCLQRGSDLSPPCDWQNSLANQRPLTNTRLLRQARVPLWTYHCSVNKARGRFVFGKKDGARWGCTDRTVSSNSLRVYFACLGRWSYVNHLNVSLTGKAGRCRTRSQGCSETTTLPCSCVYFCLYGAFNCISFHKFSRQLSIFSLCSSGLFYLSYWFFQL